MERKNKLCNWNRARNLWTPSWGWRNSWTSNIHQSTIRWQHSFR